MTFHITALYASIFTIAVIVLANIVSAKRGRAGISILHGENLDLALAIRRHGNLMENLPLVLILMALCEAGGLGATWLHVMGIASIVVRASHLAGLSIDRPTAPLRIIGGVGTQIVMLGAVGYLLWSQF
jgi:uncharacterized membrane protein YecN with MAPEG domain